MAAITTYHCNLPQISFLLQILLDLGRSSPCTIGDGLDQERFADSEFDSFIVRAKLDC